VARYPARPDVDGLPEGEGAFLLCSFWLADNLALQGRDREARAEFRRAMAMDSTDAAAWLNLAPDHLNWHASMATYEAAKARIFDLQLASDTAIGFVDDAVVMRHLDAAPARHVTFGLRGADYHSAHDELWAPSGAIADVASMGRRLPHDITNALAATALVVESGLADAAAAGRALTSFVAPPHRIEPLGERDGVQWYNDSKATTPHAAAVAIRGFDHVVLIAGGRNKDLDLSPMAAETDRVRTVIAIGESAPEITTLFEPHCEVVQADSMEAAVAAARGAARQGDVVLLSPGCASFDWYPSGGYVARGEHFRRLVTELIDAERSIDR
jgi:UDP-N-acetylmuramoylalanine--D-glutamate ligase